MSELLNNREFRIKMLKDIILDLHQGRGVEEAKRRFATLVKNVSPQEISLMEQALIREGIPLGEIQRLCDVHAAVFRDSLDRQAPPDPTAIPGHPLHTFWRENRAVEELLQTRVWPVIGTAGDGRPGNGKSLTRRELLSLLEAINLLFDLDKHYQRKEHLLFPKLEKYGVDGPSRVMWGKDDEIRALLNDVQARLMRYLETTLAHDDATSRVAGEDLGKVRELASSISEMIYKEEKILFPMAVELLTEDEWLAIYNAQDEVGYCLVEPEARWVPERVQAPPAGRVYPEKSEAKVGANAAGEYVRFDTGVLSVRELTLLLNHLPVDITFVDKDDVVRYFSRPKHRIFSRPKTVLGRKVQNCHPPASVHIVDQILRNFKEGRRDVEEFWINFQGKLVYIRYFAVRDDGGNYCGCLEVTQEVSRIKALEGEKRLLEG